MMRGCHKSRVFWILLAALLCPGCNRAAPARAEGVLFRQDWGQYFSLRATDEADTLSIGAVCATDSAIHIYDLAGGAMVVLDGSGRFIRRTVLEGLGRGGYAGDDFAVLDTQFVFVNSVDRRLEYFHAHSGKRLAGLPLPLEPLARLPKRSQRLINRIFIIDRTIYLGNEQVVFACAPGLPRADGNRALQTAPPAGRFGLLGRQAQWLYTADTVFNSGGTTRLRLPQSHYPVPGKRLLMVGNRLCALRADVDGVIIEELRP